MGKCIFLSIFIHFFGDTTKTGKSFRIALNCGAPSTSRGNRGRTEKTKKKKENGLGTGKSDQTTRDVVEA